MLLAIDAGNTNIVFAVYDGDRQIACWRCKTDSARTSDEYAALLYQLFVQSGLSFSQVKHVIISSVVPDANFHLRRFGEKMLGCPVQMVGVNSMDLGIKVKLSKPEEIGADRLVNAVAVTRFYKAPAVVVDFGTATTFDVIDKEGAYNGGVIAPGVNLSIGALHQAAAKLPKISLRKPDAVIGRDTISAMESGIYWGYIGMIEGTLTRIAKEMGDKPFVIAIGGLSSLFAGGTSLIDVTDEDLTLKGLVFLHRRNLKDAKAA